MDEATYVELRDRVRARHDQYLHDQEFLIRFIGALAHRVNVVAGRERPVCTPGTMDGATFVARHYDALGSSVGFILNFTFHDAKGNDILNAPIRLVAKCKADSFSVRCTETGDEIEQLRSAASTEDGQLAVIRMLDSALRAKVEKALEKPDLA